VAESFAPEAFLPFAEVPGLPVSAVPGHAGRLVLGRVKTGAPINIAQGRCPLYEGHSARAVTAGVRFLAEQCGIKRLFLTNAAGALDADFTVGGLMLIMDHINLLGQTPLTGGPHFVDMTEVYNLRLREQLVAAADRLQIPLQQGVYVAVPGPQYETPAEVRMLMGMGAQAVGMSTVPEAIQARALGLEVAGLSMITNLAAGLSGNELNHSEVVEVGQVAGQQLGRLLHEVLS
jgi:purine-nucleoside phosphorylase